MKTEVKKIDSTKRELSVEVSGQIVKDKFNTVFEKIAKDAKVPGFRPGNAPRDILEKHYAGHAHDQVIKELIPEVYNQALEKEALDVIDYPEIFDVKLEKDTLSFKANVEISPEIKLKEYKGIKINFKKIEVTADEVKRHLDALKESRKLEQLDNNFAKGLGYPNLEELENALRRQILLQKDNQQRQEIEHFIIETITKDLDFQVPSSLVERQLQDLVRQAKLDLALKGVSREKIDEEEKKLSEQLRSQAESQVKTYLALSEIAKREKIAVDDHLPAHVIEFLLREADWTGEIL